MGENNGIRLVRTGPTFRHLHGHKTSLGEGIYGSSRLSKVSTSSPLKEALRRHLSTSVDPHLPPAQRNQCGIFGSDIFLSLCSRSNGRNEPYLRKAEGRGCSVVRKWY